MSVPPSWASSSTAHSRAHYQPGYMMSAQQLTLHPPQSLHADEIPAVQTKAKMSLALSRGAAPHFGADSMFEPASAQRPPFADSDAPPTTSINDVFRQSSRTDFSSPVRPPRTDATSSAPTLTYVFVFGYPPDKYSATVDYFKSLGAATEPEPNSEIVNCFKIGFSDPGEAARVVRRNGEVLGGSWMIGVKWADPTTDLGSPLRASATSATSSQSHSQSSAMPTDGPSNATVMGTPIKLAPSVAAFRKGHAPAAASPAQKTAPVLTVPPQGSNLDKGILGQVTDLFFGW